MSLQVFQYQNSPVTFNFDGEVMVNATEMAKPFKKLSADFLRLAQTQDFIAALAGRYGKSHNEIVQVLQGGQTQGTWLHQKLALKFAGWLSPEFELWVYDRIEELLTTGKTELHTRSQAEIIAEGYQLALMEAERVKEQNKLLAQTITQQAPMVAYYNEVLQTEGGQVATVIAQDFGIGPVTFNRKLKELGVIRKVGGAWVLCAKYQGKGYTTTKTHTYLDKKGDSQTSIQMLWTQKGREFLFGLLKPKQTAA